MANWDAYRVLKAESERLGLPEHYKTDLTKHDRLTLSRKTAPDAFIWVLRPCGTMLWPLECGPCIDWVLATRTFHGPMPNTSGREAHWYIYEDGELTPVDPDEAVDRFMKSVLGQPVYSIKRHTPYLGDLREVRRTTTAYGKKTLILVDSAHSRTRLASYFLDDVTIGQPRTAA